jgi:hypothetical protein
MAFVKVVEGPLSYSFAYLHFNALLFKFLENRAVKHVLTGVQTATGALERDAVDRRLAAWRPCPSRRPGPDRAACPEATHVEVVLAPRRLEACANACHLSTAPRRALLAASTGRS